MNVNESSKQYVASIISIGHIIGCDFIQGFVWGKPLMPDAAEKLVMEETE